MVTAASDMQRIYNVLSNHQEQLNGILEALEKIVVVLENGDPGFRAEAVEAMTDVTLFLDQRLPKARDPDGALKLAEAWLKRWRHSDSTFRNEAIEAMTDVIIHLDPHPPGKPTPDVALEVAETWMRKWNGNWTPTF